MIEEAPSEALARELGENAASDLGLAVLRYIKKWEIDHNSHWIDLAILV